jgi:hypothetical protein
VTRASSWEYSRCGARYNTSTGKKTNRENAMPNRVFPKVLSCAVLLSFGAASFAQPGETKPSAPAGQFKPAKPQNQTGDRKFESSIAAIDSSGGATKITLTNGAMTLIIKPETEVVREERDLVASDLKIGDAVCFTALKGARSKLSIKEKAVVTGIEPLVIRIGDAAEMTFLKNELWEFYRAVPLKAADLKVGQTVAVQIRLQRDGDIATKRIAVVVSKPKPVKSKTTKTKTKPKT